MMIILAIGGFVVIALAGICVSIHSAKHAVIGYEDAMGFHEGIETENDNADAVPPCVAGAAMGTVASLENLHGILPRAPQ